MYVLHQHQYVQPDRHYLLQKYEQPWHLMHYGSFLVQLIYLKVEVFHLHHFGYHQRFRRQHGVSTGYGGIGVILVAGNESKSKNKFHPKKYI